MKTSTGVEAVRAGQDGRSGGPPVPARVDARAASGRDARQQGASNNRNALPGPSRSTGAISCVCLAVTARTRRPWSFSGSGAVVTRAIPHRPARRRCAARAPGTPPTRRRPRARAGSRCPTPARAAGQGGDPGLTAASAISARVARREHRPHRRLVARCGRASDQLDRVAHPGERSTLWCQDEARVGQIRTRVPPLVHPRRAPAGLVRSALHPGAPARGR